MKAAAWQRVTEATTATGAALSVPELTEHLRTDDASEEMLIETYARAAGGWIEEYTGRALLTQTWDVWFDCWPTDGKLELPCPPLQSVTHVKYTPAGGAQATLSPALYQVLTQVEPAQIVLAYGEAWPSGTLDAGLPVVVRMVCGWTTAEAIPEPIRQALRWLVGHMHENREAVSMANVPPQLTPMSVLWALGPYRLRYVW